MEKRATGKSTGAVPRSRGSSARSAAPSSKSNSRNQGASNRSGGYQQQSYSNYGQVQERPPKVTWTGEKKRDLVHAYYDNTNNGAKQRNYGAAMCDDFRQRHPDAAHLSNDTIMGQKYNIVNSTNQNEGILHDVRQERRMEPIAAGNSRQQVVEYGEFEMSVKYEYGYYWQN